MNSAVKAGLVAAVLLLVSLPLKVAMPISRVAADDMWQRNRVLGDFLAAAQVPKEELTLTRYGWKGWKIHLPHCDALAIPQWQLDDGTDLLRSRFGADQDMHFILHGHISDDLPYGRAMIDRMLYVLNPVMPTRGYRPFIVVMIAPQGCRDYEALPWAKLGGVI